jgi:hypothetical protein
VLRTTRNPSYVLLKDGVLMNQKTTVQLLAVPL